jgi:hypothetical protein
MGGLVGRGDLDEATAYTALLGAARTMAAYRGPWRDLEKRVAHSLKAGRDRPFVS